MKILSTAVDRHSKQEFKSWLLFVQDQPDHLKALNQAVHADNIGLCLLKGKDDQAIKSYAITVEPGIRNTVILYKNRKVTGKFINWTAKDADRLRAAIDSTCAGE